MDELNTQNPYASPVFPAELAADAYAPPRELKIASQGKRLINAIVDQVALQVLSGVFGFVLGIVFVVASMSADGRISEQEDTQLQIIGYVVGILVSFGYFIISEAAFQRTPAKLLTGTMVVTPEGGKPTLGQIVGRSFARFIPFEAFSFLGGNQPVGWHDKLSGTRVIEIR